MKKQSIIATILFSIISLLFLMSGWQKLFGGAEAQAMFDAMNIGDYRIALGVIEMIIIPTLLFKPLRTVGTLIATGYLGGAIMATIAGGMAPFMPGAIMVALWIAYKLDMWVSWMHCGCGTCKRCKNGTDMKKGMCACKPECTCSRDACDC